MKQQMLIVIQKDNKDPIVYCNKIDVDIKTEVRAAFTQLAIPYNDEVIDNVVNGMKPSFWFFNNQFCFCLIDIA